jgi:hypothetical protein
MFLVLSQMPNRLCISLMCVAAGERQAWLAWFWLPEPHHQMAHHEEGQAGGAEQGRAGVLPWI